VLSQMLHGHEAVIRFFGQFQHGSSKVQMPTYMVG
jgi:hypothetical protein